MEGAGRAIKPVTVITRVHLCAESLLVLMQVKAARLRRCFSPSPARSPSRGRDKIFSRVACSKHTSCCCCCCFFCIVLLSRSTLAPALIFASRSVSSSSRLPEPHQITHCELSFQHRRCHRHIASFSTSLEAASDWPTL